MIADRPDTQDQDVEVVDLDAMTDDELRAEEDTVREQLTGIRAQLKDPTRVGLLGANSYLEWRRRAVFAQMHLRKEWHQIKAVQRDRRVAFIEARRSEGQRIQAEQRERSRQRRLAVRDALRGNGGPEGLLLRVAVVLHALTGDQDLPADLPKACHDTLKDLSAFLIDRFGERWVSDVRAGRITVDTIVEEAADVAP